MTRSTLLRRKAVSVWAAMVAVVAGLFAASLIHNEAKATAPTASVLAEATQLAGNSQAAMLATLHEHIPAQTGAALNTAVSFTVTCATSATAIVSGSTTWAQLYCSNMSATSVFVGSSTLPTTGSNCISSTTTTCPGVYMAGPWGAGALYCKVASGTVTISCIAGK